MSWRLQPHLVATLLAVLALATPAWGQPGTLLEITLEGVFQPAQIDRLSDAGVPAARYAVAVYWIRFESTALDGSPTPITAQLFVPQLPEPAERPLYVFGAGSTGLRDACAPSLEHRLGIRWGNYRGHIMARAGHGLIGVLPDYMGFGDPAMLQPYFSAAAEGRVMLDAIRAAKNFLAQNGELRAAGAFVAGFSQGGHAAFAAADLRAEYAPEVTLHGVIGYGPTTDVVALLREFTVVAPLIVYTYARLYGEERFDPRLILAERWLASLERDVTGQCIGGIQSHYPYSVSAMFTPAFAAALADDTLAEAFPEIYRILSENSSGLSGHGLPALIQQGTEDSVVRLGTQHAFVRALCAAGSPVRYPNYLGSRHDTRAEGFALALAWMEAITRGEKPPSDCALVP